MNKAKPCTKVKATSSTRYQYSRGTVLTLSDSGALLKPLTVRTLDVQKLGLPERISFSRNYGTFHVSSLPFHKPKPINSFQATNGYSPNWLDWWIEVLRDIENSTSSFLRTKFVISFGKLSRLITLKWQNHAPTAKVSQSNNRKRRGILFTPS